MQTENYQEARRLALRAAAILPDVIGKTYPGYVFAVNIAAYASLELEEYDESEVQFREALMWQRKLYGVRSLEYSRSLIQFARLMLEMKRLIEAELISAQAISVFITVEGSEAVHMAHLLAIRAEIKASYEDYDGAEKDLKHSLVICQKTAPHSKKIKLIVLRRYAILLRAIGADDRAIQIEEQIESARRQ